MRLVLAILFVLITGIIFSNTAADNGIANEIKSNSKFHGFHENLLENIKENKLDEYNVGISVIAFHELVEDDVITQRISVLEDTLHEKHGIDVNVKPAFENQVMTKITALVPVKDLPIIAQYDFVKNISQEGFGFTYHNDEKTNGTLKINFHEHLYDISFVANNVTVIGGAASGLSINAKQGGSLELTFPRELVDYKDSYGKLSFEDPMALYGDLRETKRDGILIQDVKTTCNDKTIFFKFPNGWDKGIGFLDRSPWGRTGVETESFEAYLDTFLDDTKLIQIEDKEIEINIHSYNAICDINYRQDEQKLSIVMRGWINTENQMDIIIPNKLFGKNLVIKENGETIGHKLEIINSSKKITLQPHFKTNPVILEISDNSELISNSLLSPRQQMKNNVSEIICSEGLELIYKFRDKLPSCVKPETAIKLIQRGWAIDSNN